jgi:unsaturated chondroitin disaccharide hydrolase
MLASAVLLTLTSSQPVFSGRPLDSLVNNALRVSLVHLERSIDEVRDTTLFPTYGTKQLKWKLGKADEWTSGFYPGCLWYAYEISSDPRFERWARQWTNSLEAEKLNTQTHDLGFKFVCSYGNGLRLGKAAAYGRYREIMLRAASTLAKRFNPKVGCLESNWDKLKIENSFPVIIDIMMNLELLFWASENGGPKSYADYACTHALTTCRDFIRPDGSTYHIVRYDKNTGKVINKGTIQGAGNETTWSRGQAWGLYGMVVAYRYTKDKRFLETALRLSDYFLKHLPEDHVAPWDFQSEIKYRDASATSIVTSALFEMAKYVGDDSLKRYYESQAEAMLMSLCSPPYFTDGRDTNCVLNHSTHYFPINSNVDVPAIFADYYFLEALLRCGAHLKRD